MPLTTWPFQDSSLEISVWQWAINIMALGVLFYFGGQWGLAILPAVVVPLQYWISKKKEKIDARDD